MVCGGAAASGAAVRLDDTMAGFWIGPQLLGQPLLRAYLLAEHTGCTHDRNGLSEYPHHAHQWSGAAADVEYAVSRRASQAGSVDSASTGCPDAHIAMIRARLGVPQPGYYALEFLNFYSRSVDRRRSDRAVAL